MLLGKRNNSLGEGGREELAAILVQSESKEETHSFGPHLRLCDLLFSFSRGRGLALNPYLFESTVYSWFHGKKELLFFHQLSFVVLS